jgi:hypothetical protein
MATVDQVTVNLPDAFGIAGRMYTIKKVDTTGFDVYIDAYGGQKIEGHDYFWLYNSMDYVTVVSNGSGWYIVSQYIEAL